MKDRSVVTWGNADYGGDSSAVQDDLNDPVRLGVKTIYSTYNAFAALMNDKSVCLTPF